MLHKLSIKSQKRINSELMKYVGLRLAILTEKRRVRDPSKNHAPFFIHPIESIVQTHISQEESTL